MSGLTTFNNSINLVLADEDDKEFVEGSSSLVFVLSPLIDADEEAKTQTRKPGLRQEEEGGEEERKVKG